MKNIYLLLSVSLLIASCGPTNVVVQQSPPPPVEDVSYQSFYDQLSPYGSWINYPGYGYVWMPSAGPDFRPYSTNGNWIYTDAGWTWSSNYSWGWAPFHYGRWFYENGYGWMWIPGNEWAPAWVSWRGSGEYYGWAPLGPQVSVNVALSSYNPPPNYWNFVPRQYIGNPGWHNYYVNENRNVTIISNTTIINNYSGTDRNRYAYAPGPDPNEVRRVSGNNFTTVQLREANTPGERISGSQYVIYHPRINSTTPASRGDAAGRPATPAPARYESFNNVRPTVQQPANSPRSAAQNPANNQPPNNPRAAAQNPSNNQPVNNQPPNNSRAAAQNPSYNQPPANNQPPNNPRAGAQNPSTNQPVNNQPPNNPRSATQNPSNNLPANSPRPAVHNPNPNQQVNNHPANSTRTQNANGNQPGTSSTQPANTHQNNANHGQPAGRPATTHAPNNGQKPANNAQRTTTPQNKPADKPADKPKPESGN